MVLVKTKPLLFDDTPRYSEFTVACYLCDSALNNALDKLRPMVHARGYNNRPVEFCDTLLVVSDYWRKLAGELQDKYQGMRVQVVPAAVLKSMFTWGLVFGLDSVVSNPPG